MYSLSLFSCIFAYGVRKQSGFQQHCGLKRNSVCYLFNIQECRSLRMNNKFE